MVKIWRPDTTSWETYTEAYFEDFNVVMKKLSLYSKLWFRCCQSFNEIFQFYKVKIIVAPDYPPADYFSCGSMDIVSDKLMNVLIAESGVKAEFFPLEIFYRDQIYTDRQFFFMNILNEVDCFDFDNSIYSVDEEISQDFIDIDSIEKLVLHSVDLSKHKLFYVAEVGYSILCIVESIADKIMMVGCSGIKFVNPSEKTWGN